MAAGVKLVAIAGILYHQKWSLRLKFTQHGETHQGQTQVGVTEVAGLKLKGIDGIRSGACGVS